MRLRNRLCLVCFALLSTGCSPQPLFIQSDFIDYTDLASYVVQTPDPRKECPDIGRRLIICWDLHQLWKNDEEGILRLYVRFGNRSEEVIDYPICRPKGRIIYSLRNEDYTSRCGICTYKAEILSGGTSILCWHHQLWTDLINLDPQCDGSVFEAEPVPPEASLEVVSEPEAP